MPLYPARALERAMKIKEVITRAMSGQINWLQAAEIIGITDRSMRRWRKRLSTGGYEDLLDRRTRRPSAKRIDMAVVEKFKAVPGEIFRPECEALRGEAAQRGTDLTELHVGQNGTANAGLVQRYRKRGPHRQKRPRRPRTGMMLHVDGSRHRWIPGLDQYQVLIVIFDDATSEVYDAQLVDEESTVTVMAALKRV